MEVLNARCDQQTDVKIQVSNLITDNEENDELSSNDDDEECKSLESEMLEMCNEIEDSNSQVTIKHGDGMPDNSHDDLNYHEERQLQSIIDKVKKENQLGTNQLVDL